MYDTNNKYIIRLDGQINRLAQQHNEPKQETVRNIPGSDGTDADIHVDITK